MRKLNGIDDVMAELAEIENELKRMDDSALLALRVEKVSESLGILEESFNAGMKHEEAVMRFLKSTR